MTIFSPYSVGSTDTRKSISRLPPILSLMRPSCGSRRSAISSDAMILKRARDRVAELERRPHLLLQDAVDPEPHAEALLVRLDVDIRRLLLDRGEQDRVAQLDDRRLAGLVLEIDDVDGLVGDRGEVDVVDVELADHLIEIGALVVVARQRRLEARLRRDDRLDVVLGEELELVDRVDVRRIGHRDDQRRAVAADRDDLMLLADLARHELEHARVDLDLRQVDRRQAVLLRDELSQRLVVDVTETRQRRAQAFARALGFVLRLLKLLEREHLLANQQLSNTAH